MIIIRYKLTRKGQQKQYKKQYRKQTTKKFFKKLKTNDIINFKTIRYELTA